CILAFSAVFFMSAHSCGFTQDGALTKREIRAVVVNPPPVIDGDLSDLCWKEAAKAELFTDAFLGTPTKDQTVAYLGYDDKAIYVAFYAYDSQPNGIVARETKRGVKPEGEDIVAFSLDLFHTHKFADRSFFIVNPLGTQFAHLGGGRGTKLEWEGEWKAAAKIVADGWTAEMAIPWKILNYPAAKEPTTVGVNFDRYQQRTRVHSWWSNVGPQEFYDLDGHWVGVKLPSFRSHVSLLPYMIPGWVQKEGFTSRAGLDVRYALTQGLTAVATVNPDFATVEGAVEGIDFSYGERFVPDRRPFFQEGSEIYQTGGIAGRYFHSGRIPSFDLGTNLYGKITNRDTIGVLTAIDFGRRTDWLLRAKREFGPTSSADLAFINRDDEKLTNRVVVVGENFRRGQWGLDASWAGSWVDSRFRGSAANAFFTYQSRRMFFAVVPHHVHPGFRSELGFIPFTGFKGVEMVSGFHNEWREGFLRALHMEAGCAASDHYDGRIFRRQKRFSVGMITKSDYGFQVGWEGGRFEEFNDSVWFIGFMARFSDQFRNYGLVVMRGRQAGARKTFIAPSVKWRWGKLAVGLSSSVLRHRENAYQHILTFNYDVSPRQGFGGRVVMQTGGTNAYLSYRNSGYGGVETFVVFGDPNSPKFQKRILVKRVWAM
ncbi:MAG: carbohydrate binding family 9 domain-containing protein, partial [Armatimonadota bacterium]